MYTLSEVIISNFKITFVVRFLGTVLDSTCQQDLFNVYFEQVLGRLKHI